MAPNAQNLMKNIYLHSQEAQGSPSWINSERSTPRHIAIKLSKTKTKTKKNLESSKKKQLIMNMKSPILTADYSETMEIKRQGNDIFKQMSCRNSTSSKIILPK